MLMRTAAALALLVALGGLFWWASSTPADSGPAMGDFQVYVLGPDGVPLAADVVHARGTPYDALVALGEMEGFEVEVEQQTWIGSGCTATYVHGIGPWSETATGGWNYYVRSPGGDWSWRPEGAACLALQPGDEVEWCWVEADTCSHHAV